MNRMPTAGTESLAAISVAGFSDDLLTDSESEDVVEQVDAICGDTWCEGDLSYAFDMLTCSGEQRQCTLHFRMWEMGSIFGGPRAGGGDEQGFSWHAEILEEGLIMAECTVRPVSSVSDLVEAGNGGQLTERYYQTLSSCIFALENFIGDVENL